MHYGTDRHVKQTNANSASYACEKIQTHVDNNKTKNITSKHIKNKRPRRVDAFKEPQRPLHQSRFSCLFVFQRFQYCICFPMSLCACICVYLFTFLFWPFQYVFAFVYLCFLVVLLFYGFRFQCHMSGFDCRYDANDVGEM